MNDHLDQFDWIVGAIAALIFATIVYVYFNVPDMWYYTVTIGWWVLLLGLLVMFVRHHNKRSREFPRTRTHRRIK